MGILSLDIDDRLRLYVTLLGDDDPSLLTGSYEWNTQTGLVYWSDACFRILGLDRETVTPSREVITELVHPDDQAWVYARWSEAAATGNTPTLEYRILRKDGRMRRVRARGRTLSHPRTGAIVIVGSFTDLTPGSAYEVDTQRRIEHRMQLARSGSDGIAVGAFLGKEATVSVVQYELLMHLMERRHQTPDTAPDRSFTPPDDLITLLPWEADSVDESAVHTLIGDTRKVLEGTGLDIETGPLGFRMTVDR